MFHDDSHKESRRIILFFISSQSLRPLSALSISMSPMRGVKRDGERGRGIAVEGRKDK